MAVNFAKLRSSCGHSSAAGHRYLYLTTKLSTFSELGHSNVRLL